MAHQLPHAHAAVVAGAGQEVALGRRPQHAHALRVPGQVLDADEVVEVARLLAVDRRLAHARTRERARGPGGVGWGIRDSGTVQRGLERGWTGRGKGACAHGTRTRRYLKVVPMAPMPMDGRSWASSTTTKSDAGVSIMSDVLAPTNATAAMSELLCGAARAGAGAAVLTSSDGRVGWDGC